MTVLILLASTLKRPEPDQATRCQIEEARHTPVINVTPIIDVLLVLLIIFMVIQPHKEAKLPVLAPEDSKTDAPAPPETLMLTVSADMRLELNSQPVEAETLLPLLANLME